MRMIYRYLLCLVCVFPFVSIAQKSIQIIPDSILQKPNLILYGDLWWGDAISPLSKTLNTFCIDDKNSISKIVHAWKLDSVDGFYMCGYDYNLYIQSEDEILWHGTLNYDCEQIVVDDNPYFISKSTSELLYNNAQEIFEHDTVIKDVKGARLFYANIKEKYKDAIVFKYNWLKYDGVIEFSKSINDTLFNKKSKEYYFQIKDFFDDICKKNDCIHQTNIFVSSSEYGKFITKLYFKEDSKIEYFEGFDIYKEWTPFNDLYVSYYTR